MRDYDLYSKEIRNKRDKDLCKKSCKIRDLRDPAYIFEKNNLDGRTHENSEV